ncbi:hypothetical protein KP509_38G001600 [Ceratopteris richardii]|uniref:non-specific serine/threonine protein kinase n=1 Tax=Ceratopteris richardii TaxID=49495 RepID=A0A8T2Q235_CERRI|nr:hypothetical protein KP509_38G001600 [Ceratopteris richardii]
MTKVHRTFAVLSLLVRVLPTLITLSHAQLDEALALWTIQQAVGLTSPNLTSWNASSTDPCADKWAGVTCDSSQKYIIRLNFSGCNLTGVLPNDAFSMLTSLKTLDFSGNQLESPFPSLDNLQNLQSLNFSRNSFTGSFPETIFNLKKLMFLHLQQNNFAGPIPEGISTLKFLRQIWLGGKNRFTSPLPKGFASLPSVKYLDISGSNLKENLPSEWAVWVNLTYLNLHDTGLTGNLPSEWGPNFANLQSLILYNNSLAGIVPDSWKGLISLQRLELNHNFLSGSLPSWLSKLEKADGPVDLSCNYFTGGHPQWLKEEDRWSGNCFDSDMQTHDKICHDNKTCANGQPRPVAVPMTGRAVIAGIVVAVAVLCVILVAFYIFWSKRDLTKGRRCPKGKVAEDWVVPQGVRRFTYKEVLKATKSFDKSCEIGEGGFGKVYFGDLENGKRVAIKRAGELSRQGMREFQNEITLLSRLHHRHLVHLEGFCDDKDEQILVYEYMVNGNLHRQLFEKEAVFLNWYRRLEIALAVAQGLAYLHSFADPPIIHRDVKPSNILLDDNMTAKVSDFGISKANVDMGTHVSTRPAGTAGYWDPQYFVRYQLTTASDVYGYGVVLLQLITGQHSIDRKRLEDNSLVAWVQKSMVKQGIRAVIDPRLGPNFPVQLYEEVAEIAMKCTAFERGDRPTMKFIASKLEQILSRSAPPAEHFRPVSSTLQGETSSLQLSPAAHTTDAVRELLLRDGETELSLSTTEVEPR